MDNQMELKPCPFCGECNASAYKAKPDSIFDTWGVWCDCGAKITGYDEKQEAIDAWNTRTESKEITSLKSELATLKERDRWIPIAKEKLPSKDERVIAFSEAMKDTEADIQIAKGWMLHNPKTDITRWMPLPEVPKEETK